MRFLARLQAPAILSCRYMDQRGASPRDFGRQRPALGNVSRLLYRRFLIHPAPGILRLQDHWPPIMHIHHSPSESCVTMTNPVSTV